MRVDFGLSTLWFTVVIGLLVIPAACEKDPLAERISCGLVHQQAKQKDGEYCYTYGDAYYCTRVAKKPAE